MSQVRHSNSQHRVISRSSVINERDEWVSAFYIRSFHHFSSARFYDADDDEDDYEDVQSFP